MTINDVCNAGVEGTEYYAGNSGTLLKRENTTWTVLNSGTGRNLTSIKHAGSAQQFWAAGEGDTILWSDDGATWTSIPTGLGGNWTDISVVQTTGGQFMATVVGNGGLIAYTTMDNPPGGPVVWNSSWVPIGGHDLNSVTFYDEHIGWAVGLDGQVWQTLDGADHWTDVQFNDCYSLDANNTFIVGDGGTIIQWNWNGGSPIATLQFNPAGWTFENLNAIRMFDASNGYAVGENGTVIPFASGWGTPIQVGTTVHPDLKGIDLSAANAGYAVGSYNDGMNTEGYYVQLAGGTWGDAVKIGTAATHPVLNAVSLTAEDAGYAVGEGGYYAQLTGGTWQEPAHVGGTNPDLNGVFASGTDVYAVGAGGYYATYISAAWTVAQVGGDNPDLYDIALPLSDHGYVVGGKAGAGYTVPVTGGTFGLPVGLGTRELRGISLYGTDGHGFA
jgi:photosystem II stability/assembly factor-like uncharacterized protein